jgi:hypothetical protein
MDSVAYKEWLVESHLPERRVAALLHNAEQFCYAYQLNDLKLSPLKVAAVAKVALFQPPSPVHRFNPSGTQTALQLRPEMTLLYLETPLEYEATVTRLRRFKVKLKALTTSLCA